MSLPQMRSPAPCANMEDRAGIVRNANSNSTNLESSEAVAVRWVARKARVSLPLARAIVALASLGGRMA